MIEDIFLLDKYADRLRDICAQGNPVESDFTIDFIDLYNLNPEKALATLHDGRDTISELQRVVKDRAFQMGAVYTGHASISGVIDSGVVKQSELRHVWSLPPLRFISVKGIVSQIGLWEKQIEKAVWRCTCGNQWDENQETEFMRTPRCDIEKCRGSVSLVNDDCSYIQVQWVKLQESPDDVEPGEIPMSIQAKLRERLVGRIKPGDRVELSGWVQVRRRKPNDPNPLADPYLEVNHIEFKELSESKITVTGDDKIKFMEWASSPNHFSNLIKSTAPSLHGLENEKTAIILQRVGGVAKNIEGEKKRGDIHVLLVGDPGEGKALDIDTPIATRYGWKSMSEIIIGDTVFDEKGQPCYVVATSPIFYDRPVYEITFDDGTTIKADENHLWLTSTRASRVSKYRINNRTPSTNRTNQIYKRIIDSVKTTEEIKNTLIREDKSGSRLNHGIECSLPLILPDRELPISPYTLGAWLGDGDSGDAGFTCAEPEILAKIGKDGFNINPHAAKYHYGILGLQKLLRTNNLIKNKHIPQEYLRASIEQRYELLRGLMDTDGSCYNRGENEFCTIKDKLASGFSELLHSLGIKHKINISDAVLYGKKCGKRYRFRFTTNKKIYYVERKQTRVVIKNRLTRKYIYIKNIQRVESTPVKCIQVDSLSGLYLAGLQMIPTHNSALLKWGALMNPRSIETSGKGSTAAGLTATVLKDEETGMYSLAAGALVLADGGLVVSDEFDKMRPDDRSVLHTALEDQFVPINKAGINTKLNSRTSLLAACNPKDGTWNLSLTLKENLKGIPTPLLTRFDLIFVVSNQRSVDEEMKRVQHMINTLTRTKVEPIPYPMDELKKFYVHARGLSPTVSPEASAAIMVYYESVLHAQRRRNTTMITPRDLEGMLRLTEASAKLHLRSTASVADAEIAIKIKQASMMSSSVDPATGMVDANIINVGLSKSSVDMRRTLLQWVMDRCSESIDGTVTREEVTGYMVNTLKVESIERAKEILESMKRDTVFYEPRPNRIKAT